MSDRSGIRKDSVDDGQRELIAGIERESAEEIARITSEAEKTIGDHREAARAQIAGILADAAKRAEEQATLVRREAQAAEAVEIHRIELAARDALFVGVIARVRERLRLLIATPDYTEVLLSWIVEAAIGLGEERAIVNTSREERPLLARTLAEAERRFEAITGRKVSLVEASDPPLADQGVVLTSERARTAFNNQVETRLLRYHTTIQRMIYEAIEEQAGAQWQSG